MAHRSCMTFQLIAPSYPSGSHVVAAPQPSRFSGVTLRHLRGEEEIATVLALREDNIDLSVHHAAGGPQFETVEKKETKSASSSLSSSMAS